MNKVTKRGLLAAFRQFNKAAYCLIRQRFLLYEFEAMLQAAELLYPEDFPKAMLYLRHEVKALLAVNEISSDDIRATAYEYTVIEKKDEDEDDEVLLGYLRSEYIELGLRTFFDKYHPRLSYTYFCVICRAAFKLTPEEEAKVKTVKSKQGNTSRWGTKIIVNLTPSQLALLPPDTPEEEPTNRRSNSRDQRR